MIPQSEIDRIKGERDDPPINKAKDDVRFFPVPKEELLSIPQAAKIIGVSKQTVWKWAKSGKVPTIIVGIHSRIPLSVADELREKRNGDG